MQEHFNRDLEIMEVTSHKQVCGRFDVHTDFKCARAENEKRIPRSDIDISTCYEVDDASNLNDGNRLSRWQSRHAQEKGMWIELKLSEPISVNRLSFHYDYYAHDNAWSINILSKTDGDWKMVLKAVPFEMQPFEFINNHPIYGSQFQTISFDPVITDVLRIEIETPKEGRDWTMGEIEVYGSAPAM
jgi:hypothetical protein